MADEVEVIAVETAEVPAVSQPGDDAPASPKPVPIIEELSAKQREKWLKEPAEYPRAPKRERPAKVSTKSTDKADSSTAVASDDTVESSPTPTPGEAEPAETASASATDDSTQEKGKQPSPAEQRIKSLISETKQLKQRLAQYEQPVTPKQPEKSTEPVANAPQRPDPKKFETLDEYFEALSDYKVDLKIRDFQKQAIEDQRQRQVQVERVQFNEKVTEARKRHPDFDEFAMDPTLLIIENSPVDKWIMNRPGGMDVWHFLGKNRDRLETINKLNPQDADFELAKIELELSAPPSEPATVAVPKAPRPPSEANPRGKIDPLAAAVQAGDFSAYRRLKDAEERGKRS